MIVAGFWILICTLLGCWIGQELGHAFYGMLIGWTLSCCTVIFCVYDWVDVFITGFASAIETFVDVLDN